MSSRIVTLTTDFGTSDTYVGVMKGVILGIAPDAQIVDLTHDIAPQNLVEASVRLEGATRYFPPGTVHVVVVDPGVGSERNIVMADTSEGLYLAPDNGVLTLPLVARPIRSVYKLTARADPYCLPERSRTFHGRDVFAPVAAHLAGGLPFKDLGEPVNPEDVTTLALPRPVSERDGGTALLRAHVVYTDRFGNLITDLTGDAWQAWQTEVGDGPVPLGERIKVQAGPESCQGIRRTFADVSNAAPIAYWGSTGRLEIAIRNGSAAQRLRLSPGDAITLSCALSTNAGA